MFFFFKKLKNLKKGYRLNRQLALTKIPRFWPIVVSENFKFEGTFLSGHRSSHRAR